MDACNGVNASAYLENGRLYHGFRKGIYMYPCDEAEKDRLDIYHKIFSVARKGVLHSAPISRVQEPPRILDLGCGTGVWAIDMADTYPDSEVVGIDLVNIQPEKIPPNLRFRVPRDYESLWTYGENSWDLIHVQMACGSVSSWPELYQNVYSHLKPSTGWFEQVEIDLRPRCDDATLPTDANITQWYQHLDQATQRVFRPIAYQSNTGQMLQAAGFVNIRETIIRLPFNGWSSNPHERELGRWYNLGFVKGLEALSLAPFTRVNRWDPVKHIRPLLDAVKSEVCYRRIHAYNNLHIWIARRGPY